MNFFLPKTKKTETNKQNDEQIINACSALVCIFFALLNQCMCLLILTPTIIFVHQIKTVQNRFITSLTLKYLKISLYLFDLLCVFLIIIGGTADITVHEKIEGGKLKELHQATGGACGGTSVDTAFENRLAEILGENVMKKLREEETETYLDILREFEIAKRGMNPESTRIIRMTISYVVLNKLCLEVKNKTLEEMFTNTEGMEIRADKLHIHPTAMMKFFQPSIKELIHHIQSVLNKPSANGVSIILLVGGSAECALIQAKIKESFNSLHLVIPPEAGLAVLRGAVIFGHCPRLIKSRVLRYTYGVELCPPFDPNKHKEEKKISILNEDRCKDYFKTLISVGTDVEIGHQKFEVYRPTWFLSPEVSIEIYCSPKKDVQYIDDEDCFKLGELRVPLDLTGGNAIARLFGAPIKVAYTFGDTELKVWAVDQVSGNQTSCTIEMQEERIANQPSSPME